MQKVLVLAFETLSQCEQFYLKYGHGFDLLELRLDYLIAIDLPAITAFLVAVDLPVILTLRTKAEGGKFVGDYKQQLLELVKMPMDYLDIELSSGVEFIRGVASLCPDVRIIGSMHVFSAFTQVIYEQLAAFKCLNLYVYKVITFVDNSVAALQMMHFMAAGCLGLPLVSYAMGEPGLVTRIFAIILQMPLVYIGGAGAPSVESMFDLYRIARINADTKIIALLGTNIGHSLGREFHNKHLGSKAVYVNLPLAKHELHDFFEGIKSLPFQAFSVTTPLKQDIARFIGSDLPVINTLIRKDDYWVVDNTDVKAALSLISRVNANILVVGSGSVALSISNGLQGSEHRFTVLARSACKASRLGERAYDFSSFLFGVHEPYDLIFYTIPLTGNSFKEVLSIIKSYVTKNTLLVFFDYKNSSEHNVQLPVVTAKEFFFLQAKMQLELFKNLV